MMKLSSTIISLVFFGKENVCTFALLTVRLSKLHDRDRHRRRRQRPCTATLFGLVSPCRVDSIKDMHEHQLSRVGGQQRRFGCVLRLCIASCAHAVESRREGLQNGSHRSRRPWRLRVRSPRLRLVVLNCSYGKRRPLIRHLS